MKKLYQKIANFIYNKAKNAKTKTDFQLWFDIGMRFNNWCISRNIWLS